MEEAVKVKVRASDVRSGRLIDRWLVGVPLVLLPLLLGGAPPWFWSTVAAIVMIGALILIWSGQHENLISGISVKTILLLGAFLTYPFLQVISLPESWLSILDPQRLIWLKRAEEVTQLPSVATSISYMPLTTLFYGFFCVTLAVYALLLRKVLREEKNLGWLFTLLFCFAGFQAFYGLLQVLIPTLGMPFGHDSATRAYSGYARGTFVNRNHYAAFLGMLWPVLLTYIISLGKRSDLTTISYTEKQHLQQVRQKQIFMSFILGVVLLALFFSLSRGAIISSLIALTVLVSLGGVKRGAMSAFVAVCWMVMIAYGGIIGFDTMLSRFDLMEKDAPGRFKIWEDTARIIQDHPLTGTGLGSYRTVIRVYQSHLSDQYQVGEAHNDYLELAAELGLPVAIASVLLVWGYWWKTARRLRGGGVGKQRGEKSKSRGFQEWDARREERRLLAVGALAGSAAFLCHLWVEFNWQIPANQLYFVMLLVMMREHGAVRKEEAGARVIE